MFLEPLILLAAVNSLSEVSLVAAHGGPSPLSTMTRDGMCLGILVCLRLACGRERKVSKKTVRYYLTVFLLDIT